MCYSGIIFKILLKLRLLSLVICDVRLIEIPTNETHNSGASSVTPEIRCNAAFIDIRIPLHMVKSSLSEEILPPNSVIFRYDASEGCQAEPVDKGYYRISINLQKQDCGSTVQRKKYQTEYKNEVVLVDADAGKVKSLLNFSCVYQNEHELVVLPPSSSQVVVATGNHETTATMTLYRDKSYSEDSRITKRMPEIPVGHFVFVSLVLSAGFDNVHLVAKNCFASYFPTASDKSLLHNFISDGCADKFDSTVAIETNGDGWASKWKYQMFKWVNTSSQRIYLFCEVELCDQSKLLNRNRCSRKDSKENCFGFTYGGKSRRDVNGMDESEQERGEYIVSLGPIFPKESVLLDNSKGDGDSANENDFRKTGSSDALPVTVGVILGVCVVILSVVGYLYWKRKVSRRVAARQKGKREIQQGFAFVLKSSNDPDIFHRPTTAQATSRISAGSLGNDPTCVVVAGDQASVHATTSRPASSMKRSERKRHHERRRRHSWADRSSRHDRCGREDRRTRSPDKQLRSSSVEPPKRSNSSQNIENIDANGHCSSRRKHREHQR